MKRWIRKKPNMKAIYYDDSPLAIAFVDTEEKAALLVKEQNELFNAYETMRLRCEAAEHNQQTLMERLAEPAQRTVPAVVTFDCTVPDLRKKMEELSCKHGQFDSYAQGIMDFLSTRARAAVPEGVPTAEALRDAWNGLDESECAKYGNPFAYACASLAPFLVAPVDPALCEEPLEFLTAGFSKHSFCRVEVRSIQGEDYLTITGLAGGPNLIPIHAHLVGMHCLSFAAARGIDVRLPCESPSDGAMFRAMAALENPAMTQAQAVDTVVSGRPSPLPAPVEPAQKCLSCGAPRYTGKPCTYCNPTPIATAKTLEELVEIGRKAYNNEHYKACREIEAGAEVNRRAVIKRSLLAQVTAILRAAKPEVDIAHEIIIHGEPMKISTHFRRFLNSRIRYRVEPPSERRIDCIFCDFKANSLAELREHSANCEKHPLWHDGCTRYLVERETAFDNDWDVVTRFRELDNAKQYLPCAKPGRRVRIVKETREIVDLDGQP